MNVNVHGVIGQSNSRIGHNFLAKANQLWPAGLALVAMVIPAAARGAGLGVAGNGGNGEPAIRFESCCHAGDRCHAQLTLESLSAASHGRIQLEASPLLSAASMSTIPADAVTLEPTEIVHLLPGENRVVLVAVDLPRSLEPGLYRGPIAVRADGTLTGRTRFELPVEIEVCAPLTNSSIRWADRDHPAAEHDDPLEATDPSDPPGRRVFDDGPREPPSLTLEHRASKGGVRIGDVVTILCTVRNEGRTIARQPVIENRLPDGFVYQRTALDGRTGPEPSSRRPYRWQLPSLAAGAETTLAFQVTVTGAARRGRASFRAWVRTSDTAIGPVDAVVQVETGPKYPSGGIDGRVSYEDRDEVGCPGLRVLLDYDRETVTDDDGRFRFDAVEGGDHSVAVDPRSLPANDEIASRDSVLLRLFPGTTESVQFWLGRRPLLEISLRRAEPGRRSSAETR